MMAASAKRIGELSNMMKTRAKKRTLGLINRASGQLQVARLRFILMFDARRARAEIQDGFSKAKGALTRPFSISLRPLQVACTN
jgi:hypothetical protein